jgi:hypothetical protein
MCIHLCTLHIQGVLILRRKMYSVEIRNGILQRVHSEGSLFAVHISYISADVLHFQFENSRGPK